MNSNSIQTIETVSISTTITSRATYDEPEKRSFMESVRYYFDHLIPQFGAILAGLLVMVYGGMNLGWGIFNDQMYMQPWYVGERNISFEFFVMSWFLGVIVGTIYNCYVSRKMRKRRTYYIALLSLLISGILLVSSPRQINALIAARAWAGLSYGITYPTILIHASEISTSKIRGIVVASIHFCSMLGVFISASITLDMYLTEESVKDKSMIFGITGLVIALLGFLINSFFTRESPVYWLHRGCEKRAMKKMIYFRAETEETPHIKSTFQDLKEMMTEDQYEVKWEIFSSANWRPLLVVVLMRISFVLSFNYGLNSSMLNKADFSNSLGDFTGMAFMGARVLSMVVAVLTIDVSRKNHLIGNILSGVVLLILAALIFFHDMNSTVLVVFSFIFQLATGSGLGIIANIYSAESFNTTHKPVSISLSILLEYLLQMLIYHVVFNHFVFDSLNALGMRSGILISCGVLLVAIGKGLIFYIPETAALSLREARNTFSEKRY